VGGGTGQRLTVVVVAVLVVVVFFVVVVVRAGVRLARVQVPVVTCLCTPFCSFPPSWIWRTLCPGHCTLVTWASYRPCLVW
jgi:hypothetical protein